MEIWNENLPPSSYSPFISYHSPNPSELLQFHSHYSHCHHSDILRPYYLTRKLQKHGSITSLSWKGLYILFIPTSSFYNKPRPKDFLMSPSRHWIAGLGLDPKFSNKCNALSLSLSDSILPLTIKCTGNWPHHIWHTQATPPKTSGPKTHLPKIFSDSPASTG